MKGRKGRLPRGPHDLPRFSAFCEAEPASRGMRTASSPKGKKRSVGGQQSYRCGLIDSMILPQVHLRKPCYDFSFL